jgi:cell division protein FtsZ
VNAARAAITSPLLEASIEGARGILINIVGGPELTLFEVNEAAEIVHSVAHQDANIIFGSVVDDSLGDAVRVTVIAAGFERWESGSSARPSTSGTPVPEPIDLFGDASESSEEFSFDLDDDGDDDIPSFLR